MQRRGLFSKEVEGGRERSIAYSHLLPSLTRQRAAPRRDAAYMIHGLLHLALDLFLAGMVIAALLCTLPVLTLASAGLHRYYKRKQVRTLWRRAVNNAADPMARFRRTAEEARAAAAAEAKRKSFDWHLGTLFVLALKSMLFFLLLLQAGSLLGGPAAAWALAIAVEKTIQSGDASLALFLEPALGPLDYLFLIGVAPFLAIMSAGVHGVAAGWFTFTAAAYFWRSDANTATALGLWLLKYIIAMSLGLFELQHAVEAIGLEVADATIQEAAMLVGGVSVLLLVPSSTRGTTMSIVLAFSPSFRRRLQMIWAFVGELMILGFASLRAAAFARPPSPTLPLETAMS